MPESRPTISKKKSIALAATSFALLGVMVVGAVIFGNLVVDRADGCRPLGSPSEDDSTTLFVYSNEEDALMLCDVPQGTVEYDPPQRDPSGVRVGDSWIRLYLENDSEMQDGTPAEIEGNDLFREGSGYMILPSDLRTPVYVKGEFGSLADCLFFGSIDYESDDFDGFDGSDMFHPDRIQSCWIEVEILADFGG